MPDQSIQVGQNHFVLHRWPLGSDVSLRAWDAADEYLLDYLFRKDLFGNQRLLIVNDSFGALTVALHNQQPEVMSDSFCSQLATRYNLQINHLSVDQVKLISSLDEPSGILDWLIIKVPKTLALLEYQLIRLRPYITPDTQIIIAGMVKNLPTSVWKLLDRLVGVTDTSLAKKKAKLIFSQLNPTLDLPSNPYPVQYNLEHTDYLISNHANVFSRDSLDIGTRFFLQHLPINPNFRNIVDLGCGNGVVGLIAATKNPVATIYFVDESYMAVASARDNFKRVFTDTRQVKFLVGDGLTAFDNESIDVMLCNPPFHQNHSLSDTVATNMFKQSRRVLKKGGEIWVIGNRHLPYYSDLKKIFSSCLLISSNAKFCIFKATKNI